MHRSAIVPVFIDLSQVTGSKPAFLECLGGFQRLAPVSRCYGRTSEPKFTDLSGRNICESDRINDPDRQARQRNADGSRFSIAVQRV